MTFFVQFVLGLYKRLISPLLPPSCKYTPTCSEYAAEAIEHYGVIRGGLLSAWRVLRCNPFSKGGYDPVVGFCSAGPLTRRDPGPGIIGQDADAAPRSRS